MRALQVDEHGQPPRLTDLPIPQPGPGQISVDIEACALNFADLLMIKGTYQNTPRLPFVLGMEAAGTVRAVGPDTDAPSPGTRVAVYGGAGGLAEIGCFPASACIALPDAMPMAEAAAFQIAYGTSHVAMLRARLQPGETLLVLGAAGGVGLTAVEIGKLMGARVIACARGADKLSIAQQAGADHLIDSETQDIRQAVKDLGGADVVYDPVGGKQFTAALSACKPGGRMVVIGFASGDVAPVPANIVLVKNITVIGLNWGGFYKIEPETPLASLKQLFHWYAQGRLKPHISHRLPLDRAEEALDLLRQRKSTGKVVVTMT